MEAWSAHPTGPGVERQARHSPVGSVHDLTIGYIPAHHVLPAQATEHDPGLTHPHDIYADRRPNAQSSQIGVVGCGGVSTSEHVAHDPPSGELSGSDPSTPLSIPPDELELVPDEVAKDVVSPDISPAPPGPPALAPVTSTVGPQLAASTTAAIHE